MIELVLTAEQLESEEFGGFPATHIVLENGELSVDFEELDPDNYNKSSVGLTETLNAREHNDEYENRDENWVLSYEPTLTEE